jgi:hypothetical protein
MGALAAIPARAERLNALTFTAWKVGGGVNYPLDIGQAETLADAVTEACRRCQHKDVFVVLQRNALNGAAMLANYVVKQGAHRWVRASGAAHEVKQKTFKPELLFSMAVDTFVPIEPFSWTPGCDPVGLTDAQRNTIEVR